MKLIDGDEIIEFAEAYYKEKGYDPNELHFSLGDIRMNFGFPYTKAIPIEFIDQQIEHYRQLFEDSLYKNDDYDEKARMMVDALNLLKRRWKEHERIHKD